MGSSFSILDTLNPDVQAEASHVPTSHFKTEDISINVIYRNEDNAYNLENIEKLASNILAVGLKQNLEVMYSPCEKGKYKLISGERRWLALNKLVKEGHKEYEIVTCKISNPVSKEMEQLELISTNSYRQKTNKDLLMEVATVSKVLRKMKEEQIELQGYDLQQGRLRDIIADFLGLSRTKVARIDTINKHALERIKTLLCEDKIPFSVAYDIAGLEKAVQLKVLRKFDENGKLTSRDVKAAKDAFQEENIPGQIEMPQEVVQSSQRPVFTMMGTDEQPEAEQQVKEDSQNDECSEIKRSICKDTLSKTDLIKWFYDTLSDEIKEKLRVADGITEARKVLTKDVGEQNISFSDKNHSYTADPWNLAIDKFYKFTWASVAGIIRTSGFLDEHNVAEVEQNGKLEQETKEQVVEEVAESKASIRPTKEIQGTENKANKTVWYNPNEVVPEDSVPVLVAIKFPDRISTHEGYYANGKWEFSINAPNVPSGYRYRSGYNVLTGESLIVGWTAMPQYLEYIEGVE